MLHIWFQTTFFEMESVL